MCAIHICPRCSSRAKIVKKKSITNKLFIQNMMHLNPKCSWASITNTEYTHTISPPSSAYE